MYLSGVVIPDEYDDDEDVVVADSPGEQIYKFQQYGDDGILDGAEGFGALQAKALKAKLTRGRAGRRRVGMGRRPYQIVGMSPLHDGFGLAPLAVAGAVGGAAKTIGGIFKKPSPRYKGGPLMSTVENKKSAVERGDMAVVQELERLRRGVGTDSKGKPAWASVWNDLLPGWQYNAVQYTFIKRADPAFRGNPPPPAYIATPTTPTLMPSPVSTGTPAPAPAGVVDATGAPAPYPITSSPSPSPIPGGYAPTASETVATAATEEGVVAQSSGGLSLDPKMLLIGGAIALFVLSGKGRRR